MAEMCMHMDGCSCMRAQAHAREMDTYGMHEQGQERNVSDYGVIRSA
jgi:hypothetical protein